MYKCNNEYMEPKFGQSYEDQFQMEFELELEMEGDYELRI